MNKIISLFVALTLATVIPMIGATSSTISQDSSKSSRVRPRSLTELPFSCSYQNGCIYITFSQNIGQVEVAVTGFMSGEIYRKTGNSSTRYWIIPALTSTDEYFIEVTTSSGDYYSETLSY